MYIGPYQLSNNLIVAPMAGVTDRPFRTLCKYFGAGHAVSEMMTADKTLRMTKKSLYRANFDGELAQFLHRLLVPIQNSWLKRLVTKSQMARKLLISIWDVLQRKYVIN